MKYTSSNPSVASVGEHSGLVCAKSAGIVTITARSVADSSKYATCRVTVRDPHAVKEMKIIRLDYRYYANIDYLYVSELYNGEAYAWCSLDDNTSGTVQVDAEVQSALLELESTFQDNPQLLLTNQLYNAIHKAKMIADDIADKYSAVSSDSNE